MLKRFNFFVINKDQALFLLIRCFKHEMYLLVAFILKNIVLTVECHANLTRFACSANMNLL